MKITNGELSYSATDLSHFLACRHLTRLDIAQQQGLVAKPFIHDLGAEHLAEQGRAHEHKVLDAFKAQGFGVTAIMDEEDRELRAAQTLDAIKSGIDVIYQGALLQGNEYGLPDFLIRAKLLGGGDGYEVVDAKLARSAKALAALQTTFYSRLLTETTGTAPNNMYLALGTQERQAFEVNKFAAYERQVKAMFEEFVARPTEFPSTDTYPTPVEYCATCRWRLECSKRRRDDDDLSLVAGISGKQTKLLQASHVSTRRTLAALDPLPRIEGISKDTLGGLQIQAHLQVDREDSGKYSWKLREPERNDVGELIPNRGLLALPVPTVGDLFFDIEGARSYTEDDREFGLQYLFGVVDTADLDKSGKPRYRTWWAYDRAGEKVAFEGLVDYLFKRLREYPEAHIYHYNHYEPTAIDHLTELNRGREDALRYLMGRFGTREDEVDDLLRGERFVDLYRVVKQGLRASVESYSIKRLEPLYNFTRAVELSDVNEKMLNFEFALESGEAEAQVDVQKVIAGYNEDDCRSTLALRGWLEERRGELAGQLGVEMPRPTKEEEKETVDVDPEIALTKQRLLEGIPESAKDRTPQQEAKALLADLLEFHRRDWKPDWWDYFHRAGMSAEELLNVRGAISGLQFVEERGQVKQSVLYAYSFPAQDHGFDEGDKAHDPHADKGLTIFSLDDAKGELVIKRGKQKGEVQHPTALIKAKPSHNKGTHSAALLKLGKRLADLGDGEWPPDAAVDLLLARRPRVVGEVIRKDGEEAVDAAVRIANKLQNTCLPIQGPPGTGKTYIGAQIAIALAGAGKRVGITANSHSVIAHFLDEVAEKAEEAGRKIRIAQKPDEDEHHLSKAVELAGNNLKDRKNHEIRTFIDTGTFDLVGGTTWVWTHPDLENALDVLIVDEAAQLSLADVLACAQSAKSVILLGDPMQLSQPTKGAHPPGADVSALEHVLQGATTLPDDRGIFVEHTRRMHPKITAFTSEAFYGGRLSGIEGLERQAVISEGSLSGSGLRGVEVEHFGNDVDSPEEAEVVGGLVVDLLKSRWIDRDGNEKLMTPDDVIVVTPYNAQIRLIKKELEKSGITDVMVGTVDKFQGREAAVAVYSMASSSAVDAPRGMEFLYDGHRLNVATSRAKALSVVVASPELVRVFCSTPGQMELVNWLCLFMEGASAD